MFLTLPWTIWPFDVAALVGDLDDLEFLGLAGDVDVEVAAGVDVDLGAGEEGVHAVDGDDHAAADLATDGAGDGVALFVLREDGLPADLFVGLALGDHHHAVLALEVDEEDVKLVARLDFVGVLELIGGDGAGALAPDVHEDFVAALAGDLALHDGAGGGDAVLTVEGRQEFIVASTGLFDRLLRFANSHFGLLLSVTDALPWLGTHAVCRRGVVKRPVVSIKSFPTQGKNDTV